MALLAGVVGSIVACSEDLNGTAGCPSLCPEQNVESQDTLLEAFVAVDTTVVGYPAIGTETRLLRRVARRHARRARPSCDSIR